MHLESDFPINNGTIRVKQPGKELHTTLYNHLFAMNTFLLDFYFKRNLLESFKYFFFLAGVYYVYAQINYLDEHDVNAYQVLLNDDPFLLCTVMTHTGRSHTISKANTCYTGDVKIFGHFKCIFSQVH